MAPSWPCSSPAPLVLLICAVLGSSSGSPPKSPVSEPSSTATFRLWLAMYMKFSWASLGSSSGGRSIVQGKSGFCGENGVSHMCVNSSMMYGTLSWLA